MHKNVVDCKHYSMPKTIKRSNCVTLRDVFLVRKKKGNFFLLFVVVLLLSFFVF